MPRSGIIGTYSLPPNTNNQAPNTPISSSMFNSFASDVQQTFNDPTPVAYGGTGAATAAAAATALEVVSYAAQVLTPAQQGQARANIGADVLGGFRNKLTNPAFAIGQRKTSGSIAAGNTDWVGDRWRISNGTNQTLSWTISAGLSDNGELPKYIRTVLGFDFPVAPTTGNVDLYQWCEGAETLAGGAATQTAYFSFGADTNVQLELRQNFGSGGSSEVVYAGPSEVVTSGLFKRRSHLHNLAAVAGKTFGASNRLAAIYRITPRSASPVAYTVSGASLVEGDATAEADPFSPRHPQQELALCQRYYKNIGSIAGFYGSGDYWSIFPTPDATKDMRVEPTIGAGAITSPDTGTVLAATPTVSFMTGGGNAIISPSLNGSGYPAARWLDLQNVRLDAEL